MVEGRAIQHRRLLAEPTYMIARINAKKISDITPQHGDTGPQKVDGSRSGLNEVARGHTHQLNQGVVAGHGPPQKGRASP